MINKLKRLFLLTLTFVMLFASIPAQAAPEDRASASNFYVGETIWVTTPNGVRMHTTPEIKDDNLIMILGHGDVAKINTIYHTGWMNVTSGTHTGWVYGQEGFFDKYVATATEYNYSNKQGTIRATYLNVHSKPYLTESVIDSLRNGSVVTALAYTNTGWTKIQYNRNGRDIIGYVKSNYIVISNVTVQAEKEIFQNIYGYSAQVKSSVQNSLNVHYSPSTSADVLTSIYPGDVVTILAESKNWYKITLNVDGHMETGYIWKSYTTKKDALENLRLSKTKKKLSVKQKLHLTVRGTTGMEVTKTWKSSNKRIAKVNKNGYVTAKRPGNVKIYCTVKVGNRTKKFTCNIKVKSTSSSQIAVTR